MNILIKYPSRGRPHTFKTTLQLYVDRLSGKHNVMFIFTFDENDSSMNNDDVREFIKSLNINEKHYYGHSTSKIEAINADLHGEDFDVLILAADDMIPTLKNYDEVICDLFESSEHKLDTMLHFHSTRWCMLLDIGCVMGRAYYDRFGYIYHPGYKSLFCDNEYTLVSKMLDRNVFVPGVEPFFHDHRPGDETDQKNNQFNREDWQYFESRKLLNFDLPSQYKLPDSAL